MSGLCLTSCCGELWIQRVNVTSPRYNRHSGYNEVACRKFVISGASVITQAAYNEAILKVPGTSLCPASTALWLRRRSAAAYMAGVLENSRTRNPLTLCRVPALVHVRVWVHIPVDPQSVQLRNATTTITTTVLLLLLLLL